MADMFDCINQALTDGHIAPRSAREAQDQFNQLAEQYARTHPVDLARQMARDDLTKVWREKVLRRRHVLMNQLQVMRRNRAIIEAAPRPDLAVVSALERIEGVQGFPSSVRFQHEALRVQFQGQIAEFLASHARTLTGRVRNKAQLKNVVRELHGQGTGDPKAKAMADAITAVRDRARALFNAYGGDIGELADFGVPHAHNSRAMRKAGFDAWAADIGPRLDWSRIVTPSNLPMATRPGQPMAGPNLRPDPVDERAFLRRMWDNITTESWNTREPTMNIMGRALYNRRADARVLHFKGADDWMAYNETFGMANPFDAIVAHIDGMARDIALMRVLGPNPRMGLEHAIQTAEKRAAELGDDRMRQRAKSARYRASVMLDILNGAANTPVNGFMGAFFAGTRNLLTAAQLGSATLSAASDLGTMSMAARQIGMNDRSLIARQMKLLTSRQTRESAARLGYIAGTLASSSSTMNRYMGETWAPEITETIANGVLRASLLSHWTDVNRTAFRLEFAGLLAEQADRPLSSVIAPLQKLMRDHGITETDWDRIRAGGLFTTDTGETFLQPDYWRQARAADLPAAELEGLSIKMQEMIEGQLEYAVPSVSVRARSIFLGNTRPGSFVGELVRSGVMYKNFALSFSLNQWARAMAKAGTRNRLMYAGGMIAMMTAFGALSLQLRELAKGNDPADMTRRTFWGAAFFQGGGVGIFGDFLASSTNRFGGGIPETLAGPVAGLATDVARLTVNPWQRLGEGKDPLIGRDVVNFLRYNAPGTNIWYLRTALDRAVWDQLQLLVDDDAAKLWKTQATNQWKRRGNSTWWRKGEMLPYRAPRMTNALDPVRTK